MDAVEVIGVVGTCAAERRQYARGLAEEGGRMLIPAERLAVSPDPADEAAALALWADRPAGAVAEFPADCPVTAAIGALATPGAGTRLTAIDCVVDALHLLDDLAVERFVTTERDLFGRPLDCAALALLTVTQIEYASTIVLVNWEALGTPDLSTVLALLSSLAPRARLRLRRDERDRGPIGASYAPGQDRAGWVALLNGEADPHMTDPRVSGFRYEQLRPLHPVRLQRLLDERIEPGEFGSVIRSAGFCRFATRPGETLQWDHVGRTIAFHLAATEEGTDDGDMLAMGQDLAFIGLDLDRETLVRALDETALTDAEFAAGPAAWARFTDPFPVWSPASGSAD